jgi:hypothetical protein
MIHDALVAEDDEAPAKRRFVGGVSRLQSDQEVGFRFCTGIGKFIKARRCLDIAR